MRHGRQYLDFEAEEAGSNRQTASLAALAVTLFLVVVSLALVHQLRHKAAFEDCVMSGRVTCATDPTLP